RCQRGSTLPPCPPTSTAFPYTTLFRSPPTPPPRAAPRPRPGVHPTRPILGLLPTNPRAIAIEDGSAGMKKAVDWDVEEKKGPERDRKSTRLNSSHLGISYAVFCLKKKN